MKSVYQYMFSIRIQFSIISDFLIFDSTISIYTYILEEKKLIAALQYTYTCIDLLFFIFYTKIISFTAISHILCTFEYIIIDSDYKFF